MDARVIPDGFVCCSTPDGQFAELVGPLYLNRDASGISYGFRVDARHGNARGKIHGGMLLTLADQVLGLTAVDAIGHLSIVTLSLNSEFVSGAEVGDWLVDSADVVRRTGTMLFMRGVIRRGEDIVLNSSGIWRYFPRRSLLND